MTMHNACSFIRCERVVREADEDFHQTYIKGYETARMTSRMHIDN